MVLCPVKTVKIVKLAASIAMNPHYHPYSDLPSPHPPSPDNNNYPPMPGVHHHNGHMGPMGDGQQGFHQMNNNNGPIKICAGCQGKLVSFLLSFC